MDKITVALPYYNGKRWIKKAITSVLNQTYRNFELLIVDDGSRDNLEDILKEFNDVRVRYIRKKHSGFSTTTNRCIKEAKGEFIGFFSQDDEWLETKLEKQIKYLKKNNLDFVHCDVIEIDEGDSIIRQRNTKHIFKNRKNLIKKLFLGNFICFQSVLVKKKCFEKIGMFDEKMTVFSDHDMWIRIAGQYSMGYINEPLVKKRIHKNQGMQVYRLEGIDDEFRMLKKMVKTYSFLKKYENKKKSNLYFKRGLNQLKNGQKNNKFKYNFAKSIKYNPLNLKNYPVFLAPNICLKAKKFILK